MKGECFQNLTLEAFALEMCMGMENAGFLCFPCDSHENGNQIAKTNGNGMGMGIAQMGMGTLIINVLSHA